MEKITNEMIHEINELARKSKTVGLTESEKKRQNELRQEYLRLFRKGFQQQLQNVKVVDSQGRDVTPSRRKKNK